MGRVIGDRVTNEMVSIGDLIGCWGNPVKSEGGLLDRFYTRGAKISRTGMLHGVDPRWEEMIAMI